MALLIRQLELTRQYIIKFSRKNVKTSAFSHKGSQMGAVAELQTSASRVSAQMEVSALVKMKVNFAFTLVSVMWAWDVPLKRSSHS
jgi:hypothetical protein